MEMERKFMKTRGGMRFKPSCSDGKSDVERCDTRLVEEFLPPQ